MDTSDKSPAYRQQSLRDEDRLASKMHRATVGPFA